MPVLSHHQSELVPSSRIDKKHVLFTNRENSCASKQMFDMLVCRGLARKILVPDKIFMKCKEKGYFDNYSPFDTDFSLILQLLRLVVVVLGIYTQN